MVSQAALESAEKELLRHLRLGKSIRSKNGANRVRGFVLAALANPATQRLCRTYKIRTDELCTVCTEIIAATPEPVSSLPATTSLFDDPAQLEKFLKEVYHVTHGQTPLRRRNAIVSCAKRRAAQRAAAEKTLRKIPRSLLLKASIKTQLPLILICAAVIVAGILLAIFLL